MPSCITHQLVADEAKKLFPPEAQAVIARAPDEYFLGCQGPDVFFFYKVTARKEFNLGRFMHRYRVFDLFCLFLNALKEGEGALPLNEEERTQVFSYVLGFITHYAADSTFHPFVYNYLEEKKAAKRVHQQMENDWDVYLLRKLRGREVEKYPFEFSPKTLIKRGTLAKFYHYLSINLDRSKVKPRKFNGCIKLFAWYLNFFHGKCYRRQRGWERTERFFHAKKWLSALYPRKDPAPEFLAGEHFYALSNQRGENIDALFACAVRESARLTELFLKAMSGAELKREDFGRGLLTGELL